MKYLIAIGLVVGCANANEVTCSDGTICAPTKTCDTIHHLCVDPGAFTACEGKQPNDPCLDGGSCVDGVCLPKVCGDGVKQAGEDCDGAQLGDITDCMQLGFYDPGPVACNTLCRYDASACTGSCGEGVLDPVELCDGTPPTQGCLGFGYDAGFLDCVANGCVPAFGGCHQIGWIPTNLPSATRVDAFATTDTHRRYAGLASTLFEQQIDGTWQVVHQDQGEYIKAMVGTGDGVWVAGDVHLHRYENGSWTDVPAIEVDDRRVTLAALGPNDVYAWIEAVGAYRFDGTAWTALPAMPHANDAWSDGTDVWVMRPGSIARGHGSTFTPLASQPALDQMGAIWGSGSTVFVAGSFGGTTAVVARWDGAAWHSFDVSTELGTSIATRVRGLAADDVYAVGPTNVLVHFDGTSWQRTTKYAGSVVLLAESAGELYLGAADGVIARRASSEFVDVTSTIAPVLTGSIKTALGIWGRSCDDVFAIGGGFGGTASTIVHFDGAQWTEELAVDATNPFSFTSLFGTATDVFATNSEGVIYKRTGTTWGVHRTLAPAVRIEDGTAVGGQIFLATTLGVERFDGTEWTTTQMTAIHPHGIWARSPNDVYVVGYGTVAGAAVHFDGTAWSPIAMPAGTRSLTKIWGDASAAFAVGEGGEIVRFDGAIATRESSGTVAPLYGIHGTSRDDVFAIDQNGGIFHRTSEHWDPVRNDRFGRYGVWTGGVCTYFAGNEGSAIRVSRLYRSAPW